MTLDRLGHAQALELLPWYAADALDAHEAREVEDHLRSCSDCRAELEVERRMREVIRASATPRISPHSSSFDRLMGRVEAADRRRVGVRIGRLGAGVGEALRRAMPARRLRTALLVVVHNVLLVVVVLGITRTLDQRATEPESSTAPEFETRTRPAAVDEARLRLVFRDDVAMWEIIDLLRDQGLSLVSGPSEVGVFEVESSSGAAGLSEVSRRLRADPRVRLVAGLP